MTLNYQIHQNLYRHRKYRKARKTTYKKKAKEEKAHIVIIQGFALSPKNVEVLIDQLMERLKALERDEIGGSDIFDGTAKAQVSPNFIMVILCIRIEKILKATNLMIWIRRGK